MTLIPPKSGKVAGVYYERDFLERKFWVVTYPEILESDGLIKDFSAISVHRRTKKGRA